MDKNKLDQVVDSVVVEEPLEVYVVDSSTPYILLMRTPGEDEVLVKGLLFSMGLTSVHSNLNFRQQSQHAIFVEGEGISLTKPQNVMQYSSCGLCNRPSWEDVELHSTFPIYDRTAQISKDLILSCATSLFEEGDLFSITGGNHKVILVPFDKGTRYSAEDVGRHNAFDKVIGKAIGHKVLPLSRHIAVLSGRCSYEMLQKAWLSGIPVVVCLGAPSSKAVELAEAAGITLVGFAKADRFNIYSHPYRIKDEN